MSQIRIHRETNQGLLSIIKNPPYRYNDLAVYECLPGYHLYNPVKHMCHGKRNWTNLRQSRCVRSCKSRNIWKVISLGIACGVECLVDQDCSQSEQCLCDGHCGRSCTNPNVDCGSAGIVANATIRYTGSGLKKMAHYFCDRGFYLYYGSPSRKCTGSGIYDGNLPVCREIECSDPLPSMVSMGGGIKDYFPGPFYVGQTFTFTCPPTHNLLGDPNRTCEEDGTWSGKPTVCSLKDSGNMNNAANCPHPGVPINGRIKSQANFSVKSLVQFECDDSYLMVGDQTQECLYFLQWSGGAAPKCINPDYRSQSRNAIERIQSDVETFFRKSYGQSPHRSSGGSGSTELYFVIDASSGDENDYLMDNLPIIVKSFLQKVLNESISEHRVGIIMFAAKSVVLQQVKEKVYSTTQIVNTMSRISKDKENIRDRLGRVSLIRQGVAKLSETIEKSFNEVDSRMKPRLVFFLLNEQTRVDETTLGYMTKMHSIFRANIPTFFVHFTCEGCKLLLRRLKRGFLKLLSSESHLSISQPPFGLDDEESSLIPKRKEPSLNISSCGKAGNLQKLKKSLSSVAKIYSGSEAKKGAWPWHVLISKNNSSPNILNGYIGGGSLVNHQWVITAAHIFNDFVGRNKIPSHWLVMGTNKRNLENEKPKAFLAERIVLHPEYKQFNSSYIILDFDVALIRIGREYIRHGEVFQPLQNVGWVDYGEFVKPVCLPCSPNNCLSKLELSPNTREHDRCRMEGAYMSSIRNRSLDIVTGFGVTSADSWFNSDVLRQGAIRVKSKEKCTMAVSSMSNERKQTFKFTERMLCALGGSRHNPVDACKGDSGGPLVREIVNRFTHESCWVQYGIVSWGAPCGNTDYPGFYTNIFTVLPWIKKTMFKSTGNTVASTNDEICFSNPEAIEPGRKCRKPCQTNADCKGQLKRCLCDGLCGKSCYNPVAICSDLPPFPNGHIKGDRTYNKSVTYTCSNGYFLVGNSTRQCRSDKRWSGKPPKCEKSRCNNIQSLPNGLVETDRDVGGITIFLCNPGYQLVGLRYITCQTNATWSNQPPTCHPISCFNLPPIKHGYIKGNNTFEGTVTYHCNDGYEIMGRFHNRTCNSDGTWSDEAPRCQKRLCSELESIQNGKIEYSTSIGSIAIYVCNIGYTLNGARYQICGPNALWSGSVPTCNPITCVIPSIRNGKFTGKRTYGQTIKYTCNVGYTLQGRKTRTCRSDRRWSGVSPICQVVTCQSPSPILNGQVYGATNYRDTVRYVCNPDFTLNGTSSRTCRSDGTWSGEQPFCQETDYSLCGQSVSDEKKYLGRIISGKPSKERSWPWHTILSRRRGNQYRTYNGWLLGAGSLINNNFVLTTAHLVGYSKNVEDLLLTFGMLHRPLNNSDTLASSVRLFGGSRVFIHPSYVRNKYDNDVALVKIGEEFSFVNGSWKVVSPGGRVEYTAYIRPVCLPCMGNTCVGKQLRKISTGVSLLNGSESNEEKCKIEGDWLLKDEQSNSTSPLFTIIGFGYTSIRKVPNRLQEGLVEIRKEKYCRDAAKHASAELHTTLYNSKSMLCAIGRNVKHRVDACIGDSGGMMARQIVDTETKQSCWVQVGIISWGIQCSITMEVNGIKLPMPGFYTKVSVVMGWIKSTLKSNVP